MRILIISLVLGAFAITGTMDYSEEYPDVITTQH